METELVTSLADKGAVGVVILAIVALGYIVNVFLNHIAEQSKLSRISQTDNTNVMAGALKEVTAVVQEMHTNTKTDHAILMKTGDQMVNKLDEVHEAVKTKLKRK